MTNELKSIIKLILSATITAFTIYGITMAIYFA